jgi:NCS1 family nucleobase:cation symporter-1
MAVGDSCVDHRRTPQGHIFKWLIAYSSLLGPVGGIMIVDYFLIRAKQLSTANLYQPSGPYWFTSGFNLKALLALALGILPNVPGFLMEIGMMDKSGMFAAVGGLYNYAWFIGFFLSGATYFILMRFSDRKLIVSRFEAAKCYSA